TGVRPARPAPGRRRMVAAPPCRDVRRNALPRPVGGAGAGRLPARCLRAQDEPAAAKAPAPAPGALAASDPPAPPHRQTPTTGPAGRPTRAAETAARRRPPVAPYGPASAAVLASFEGRTSQGSPSV